MQDEIKETTAEEIVAIYQGEEPGPQDEGENLVKLEDKEA